MHILSPFFVTYSPVLLFYVILLLLLLNSPVISLIGKSLLFLLLASVVSIIAIESIYHSANTEEKLGILTLIIVSTILISQNLATPWVIILIEIQTYIMLSTSSWLRGAPKNAFNEACLTYILPAALSTFTMCGGFLSYVVSGLNSLYPSILISLALLVKLGAVPFYLWVKTVYSGISWTAIIILGVLNKIGVIIILSYNIPSGYTVYLLVGILSITVGSIVASNQIGLKELWGFSGVASMGLIIVLLFTARKANYSSSLTYTFNQEIITFLLVYALSILPFILIISITGLNNQNNINFHLHKLNKSTTQAYILIIALLSSAGIPPLAGFAIKFIVLSEVSNLSTGSLAIVILLLNLPLVMAYLRLVSKITGLEPSVYYYNLSQVKVPLRLSSLAIILSLISLLISLIMLLNLA